MIALELNITQKKFRDNKNFTTNIYRIQANDSIMRGYLCFGRKGKPSRDYVNVFSPHENEKIIKYYWNIFGNSKLKDLFMNRF